LAIEEKNARKNNSKSKNINTDIKSDYIYFCGSNLLARLAIRLLVVEISPSPSKWTIWELKTLKILSK
jgi:hypothetical protein